MLEDRHIKGLQALYEKRFGKKLSRADAIRAAPVLLRQVQLIYRPISKAEYEHTQKRRKQMSEL